MRSFDFARALDQLLGVRHFHCPLETKQVFERGRSWAVEIEVPRECSGINHDDRESADDNAGGDST